MTDEVKLRAIPKKNTIIIFAAITVYALIFAFLGFLVGKIDGTSSQMPKYSLNIWKVIAILISLYTLSTPWRWQKRIIAIANRHNISAFRFWSILMLFCFIPFIAPLLYGFLLLFFGMSLLEYCPFIGLSILSALAWIIYNWKAHDAR